MLLLFSVGLVLCVTAPAPVVLTFRGLLLTVAPNVSVFRLFCSIRLFSAPLMVTSRIRFAPRSSGVRCRIPDRSKVFNVSIASAAVFGASGARGEPYFANDFGLFF